MPTVATTQAVGLHRGLVRGYRRTGTATSSVAPVAEVGTAASIIRDGGASAVAAPLAGVVGRASHPESWPDAEVIVKTWLAEQLGATINGALTGVKRPSNLVSVMPLLMVAQFGGSSDNPWQDRANVDVDIYAATEAGAKTIIFAVHRLTLLWRNHIAAGGHVVTGTRNLVRPAARPYDSRNAVWRYGASYTVLLRPSYRA